MIARVIRGLLKRLNVSDERLGEMIGVGRESIFRWKRDDGQFPRMYHFRRIKELWELSRAIQEDEFFWLDRKEPPTFGE
jgi:hypothetical protein